ncbi:hypothetical protein Fmac_012693 [Flemingia macrophylla]|uniref:Uncharacterized protein n=1 Tax=Flemingia macrophylla TaxID=520843 RepID=A0ABD1MR12_9FABA
MVSSPRSTTFLLVFILLPLRFSTAHQVLNLGKKTLVVAKLETARSPPANVEKIYHGVPAVAGTDHQRTRFLHGRKMMSRGVNSKNDVKAENGVNMAKTSLTTKWKARCAISNCKHEEGRGILNVKHKVSKRNNGKYSTKVKMSGLVPLNADYYVPRPHPPKNN